jgi:mannose-6-phosphate isomerase
VTSSRTLETRIVDKVWGRDVLPAPFVAPEGRRIGEIWFEPPPEMSELLVKYLFTSESLSVQVHPDDANAPHGERGKDECWLVLSAEPGARIALGFTHALSPETMRAAAIDGTIEDLLAWHPVAPGDFVYLPAGTVHAIGPGISLLEVQQNSDVTYRLYDYGRPRDLHLDAAIAVAEGAQHDPALRRRVKDRGHVRLVDGPHFRLDRLDGPPDSEILAHYGRRPLIVIPLNACLHLDGLVIAPGECALASSLAGVTLEPDNRALIVQNVSSAEPSEP